MKTESKKQRKKKRPVPHNRASLRQMFEQATDCWENLHVMAKLIRMNASANFFSRRSSTRTFEIMMHEVDDLHQLFLKIRKQALKT